MLPLMSLGAEADVALQPSAESQATAKEQVAKKPVPKKTKRKAPKKPAAPPPPPPPPPSPPPPPPEEPLASIIGVADTPHDYLAGKFVGFIGGIDRFFGDDRNYQETNDSVFQLDFFRVMGYSGEHRFILSGRAKVHLPIAEKRLHLLFETDPDKNVSIDSTQKQTAPLKQPTKPESYAAALRFERAREQRWHFSADGGIKFAGLNSTPFVRTRASLTTPLGEWLIKPAETLFWFNTIGAGATTQLDFDRPISESLMFRASSNATWLHDAQSFSLRQDFSSFHTLDERTALLYQASVIGVSRPNAHVTDYVVLAVYRYRLHREWMFFELSPQLHFPRDRDYRPNSLLSLRLEMLFEESKRSQ